MTKLSINELSKANSAPQLESVRNAGEYAKSLANNINNFVNESKTILQGKAYDAIRNVAENYQSTFNKLESVCTKAVDTSINANNKLIEYMEDYDSLDDSLIPQVTASLQAAKASLAWLKDTHKECIEKEDLSQECYDVQNGTAEQIAECEAMISELSALLSKLEGLAPIDSSAFDDIAAVMDEVNSFLGFVGLLKTSTYAKEKETLDKILEGVIDSEKSNGLIIPEYTTYIDGNGNEVKVKNVPNSQRAWGPLVAEWSKNKASRQYEYSDYTGGGCGPTCAAEVYSNVTNKYISPIDFLELLGDNGVYPDSHSQQIFNVEGINESLGTHTFKVANETSNYIDFLSNDGELIIGAWNGGHYVALTDYNPETQKFTVLDPDVNVPNGVTDIHQELSKNDIWNKYSPISGCVGIASVNSENFDELSSKYSSLI